MTALSDAEEVCRN